MLEGIISGIVAMAFLVIVVDTVITYRASAGTFMQRVWLACRESATIAWARFVVAVGFGTDALVWIADLCNAPQVSAALQQYASPKLVAALMVGTALIVELARRRPGSKDPITNVSDH